MSDTIDMYRDLKEHRRELREALGVPCPNCRVKQPKREPSTLLPQQRCKVDGYRDPRSEVVVSAWNAARSVAKQDDAPVSVPHMDRGGL